MYLHSSQRVLSDQSRLATLLQGLRSENGHTLNDNDIEFFTDNFHLMNPRFTDEDRKTFVKMLCFCFLYEIPKIFSINKNYERHISMGILLQGLNQKHLTVYVKFQITPTMTPNVCHPLHIYALMLELHSQAAIFALNGDYSMAPLEQ